MPSAGLRHCSMGVVRARSRIVSATCAVLIHTFCPFTT
jgi:hypothetical protein